METRIKNSQIESTLAKYLEFRIFELFKNKLIDTIKPHCRENSKEDVYKHLFLCPAQMSKKRNFQLHGVLSPFVCFWRTSMLEFNNEEGLYGRSVLKRSFEYTDKDGNSKAEEGFLYDVKFTMELFSSSYYKTFRDRVNQDLLDFDRLRYFEIDVKELLKDCCGMNTRAEVKLEGMAATDNVSEDNQNRSFDLNAKYTVKISIPYCRETDYLTGIKLYLNDNIIYEHDGESEIIPGQTS